MAPRRAGRARAGWSRSLSLRGRRSAPMLGAMAPRGARRARAGWSRSLSLRGRRSAPMLGAMAPRGARRARAGWSRSLVRDGCAPCGAGNGGARQASELGATARTTVRHPAARAARRRSGLRVAQEAPPACCCADRPPRPRDTEASAGEPHATPRHRPVRFPRHPRHRPVSFRDTEAPAPFGGCAPRGWCMMHQRCDEECTSVVRDAADDGEEYVSVMKDAPVRVVHGAPPVFGHGPAGHPG
jgi:hypothetical protein